MIVTPGIRFGSDFAIYEHGPGIDHAPFIVTVKNEEDTMGPFEVVLAGRLATTVRKQFTIAVPNSRKTSRLLGLSMVQSVAMGQLELARY